MDPGNNQVLYAATGVSQCPNGVGGLFKTTDGGASWTKAIDDEIMITVRVAPTDSNIVYAGSFGAFYKSTDGGQNFSEYSLSGQGAWGASGVFGGFPIDVTIDPNDPNILYANSYGGGVFRSTDGAQTWEVWSDGFTGAIVYDVVIPDYNGSVVLLAGRSGSFKSTDYGSTWTGLSNYVAGTPDMLAIQQHPTNSNIMIISSDASLILNYTTDGGSTFTRYQNSAPANGASSVEFSQANPNIVYATVGPTPLYPTDILTVEFSGVILYKSTDAGATFTGISCELDGVRVMELISSPTDADTLWAATLDGLYKTTDGGTSWTRNSVLGQKQLIAVDIDFSRSSPKIVVGVAYGGVYVSNDGGTTWDGPNVTGFNSGNPYVNSIEIDPEDPNIVFASDLYSGVYKSTDGGQSWSPFPDSSMTGLDNKSVIDIGLSKEVLYAGTQGGGVFRYVR